MKPYNLEMFRKLLHFHLEKKNRGKNGYSSYVNYGQAWGNKFIVSGISATLLYHNSDFLRGFLDAVASQSSGLKFTQSVCDQC